MSPAPPHTPCHDVETPPPPSSSLLSDANLRFPHLRGVLWRVNLGILPSSSVDDLRRVTADSRRRYAGLRRHLLVDPHLPKDGSTSPDLVMDNPLSQNPDSTWGRFFRNAELERMVDQDLSRLYPEHGSFFQTLGCQGMLRRILLLWCLRHPECGYRQGMHELLAPLLYVLHVDVEHLNEVRKLYEDHFTDRFDELSFQENDITYNFDFKKSLDSREDDNGPEGISKKARSLTELDPEIQTVVLLSDAYGAEGELGIVLSEKFMEHDAFCMFDSLMKGAHGSVAMADFFTPSPTAGSHSGLPPVIEASAALYHVLSFADSSLHSHLVELGVEPQYFALRWLRVLFGREFALPDLLIIWDEIFSAENSKLDKGTENDRSSCFRIINSPRGTLIIAIAVSMMLYIRSSLLATENAASCLQRLLNFPENINLRKLIDKAKALQVLASSPSVLLASYSFDGVYNNSRPFRVPGPASDAISPRTPLSAVPDSYWEEKWRVLHKAEELRQGSLEKQSHTQKKGWSEKVKLRLSRTSSDPSPAKTKSYGKAQSSSARRSLLEDLSQQLGLEEETDNKSGEDLSDQKHCNFVEVEVDGQNAARQEFTCAAEETCVSGDVTGEDNSSMFSGTASPASAVNDAEKDSERSSIASNSSVDESYDPLQTTPKDLPLPVSQHADVAIPDSPCHDDCVGKTGAILRERKLLSGKFQWFWKFGRNTINEEMSEKGVGNSEAAISTNGDSKSNATGSSVVSVPRNTSSTSKGDAVDQNVMVTLKNLGQSMLEHIQVLESVFQQDRGQAASLDFSKSVLVGRGQVTAMTALKELRKISNLLSEM